LDNLTFTQDITNCSGVITAGGFQTISEALYLGKKLFVIPIKKQSEQIGNTKILAGMGVKTSLELEAHEIKTWLENPNTIQIKFEDDLEKIVAAQAEKSSVEVFMCAGVHVFIGTVSPGLSGESSERAQYYQHRKPEFSKLIPARAVHLLAHSI
jgi:hypothetical protein